MFCWGDNRNMCLGTQQDGEFYSEPQKVWAFDVMIDGVGRGPPRSIACGTGFTLVALHEYTGPSEAELIAEERRVAAEEEIERLRAAEEVRAWVCFFLFCFVLFCFVLWFCRRFGCDCVVRLHEGVCRGCGLFRFWFLRGWMWAWVSCLHCAAHVAHRGRGCWALLVCTHRHWWRRSWRLRACARKSWLPRVWRRVAGALRVPCARRARALNRTCSSPSCATTVAIRAIGTSDGPHVIGRSLPCWCACWTCYVATTVLGRLGG